MKILGIDIGSRFLGFSVCDFSNEEKTLILADYLVLKQPEIKDRLVEVEWFCSSLIEKHNIDSIVYEAPYMRASKNAMGLYFVTGVVQLLAGKYNLPITPVSAAHVKKVVAGSGKAEKLDVERGVKSYFSCPDFEFKKDHASDAAAVSIAGYLECN